MNTDMDYVKPYLTEPGVKSYLNYALKHSHTIRINYYNTIYNIILFVGFTFILGIILYVKYKGKPTEEEKQQKEREKKQYILEKIKNFQVAKREDDKDTLITGLPHWTPPISPSANL
jgi:large-conductance mechanosensitive channel